MCPNSHLQEEQMFVHSMYQHPEAQQLQSTATASTRPDYSQRTVPMGRQLLLDPNRFKDLIDFLN